MKRHVHMSMWLGMTVAGVFEDATGMSNALGRRACDWEDAGPSGDVIITTLNSVENHGARMHRIYQNVTCPACLVLVDAINEKRAEDRRPRGPIEPEGEPHTVPARFTRFPSSR